MATNLNWSTIVITEYAYLYFSDEPSSYSLHSLRFLVDGDLLVADVVVSTFAADVYMLPPVLWVPLDFFNDIVIRLSRLIRTGLPLLLVQPSD
jgi:hypothetical protein